METSVNNKCKAFTSLEQSRKLAEILPLESADMYYEWPNKKIHFKDDKYNGMGGSCWSLAALLGVLPNDTSLLYFDDAYQMVYDKKPYVISDKFDNPVDACYEIITKLHELKML